MLQTEYDLRTVSALQRDQTDSLCEMQKQATDKGQNKTQPPGCGLLLIIRQGKAAQHPRSQHPATCKSSSCLKALSCPHAPVAVAQMGTVDLPQAEPGDCECPAPTTGLHFLLEG